ncbi:MAG TPA: Na+/H+ antiporter NhaC family protein, partial [Thermosynergistes sp.]|nr:Na+/H+ antiporter NhaC family protein [Thermosynergistes sp.]
METRNEALRGKPAERGATRKPSSLEAIVALALSFGVIIVGVRLRVGMTTPLVAGTIVAGLFARYLGYRWGELQTAMMEGIMHALPAVLILMLVGMTIGIWIIGGTVPTLVYYGLKLISPRAFLAATFILCAITSIATGTSFGTIGTIGLALIGIGEGLSIPLPMVAGAIVAGAYFGDKMSPLSDTTNVAPAMAGAELFEHIGSMMYTTVPAFLVSLAIYAVMGMRFGGEAAG